MQIHTDNLLKYILSNTVPTFVLIFFFTLLSRELLEFARENDHVAQEIAER